MRLHRLAFLLVLSACSAARGQDGMTCPPEPIVDRMSKTAADMVDPKIAFHVAPDGDDGSDGSAARPFASLERARAAMRGGPVRMTVVAGGTYRLRHSLVLGPDDAGTSYIARRGGAAVLDGAALDSLIVIRDTSHVTISGMTLQQAGAGGAMLLERGGGHRVTANLIRDSVNGIVLSGSGDNTVQGNRILRSGASAVEAKDGADRNLFDGNSIHTTCAIGTKGGGFFLHGASDNAIIHNLVENTAGMGIGVLNWDEATISLRNRIRYNIVRHTNRLSYDSGAIYLLGRSHRDMGAVVADNLVDDTGGARDHSIGIYLDDSTSGVEVTGNVLRNLGTHAVQVHGGDDVVVRNNVFDLGGSSASVVLFQSAPADTAPTNTMLGNVVSGNIVLSRRASPVIYESIEGGTPVVRGNLYHSTVGRIVLMDDAAVKDSQPVFADPGFVDSAAGDYRLCSDAALPFDFRPIELHRMGPRKAADR